MIRFSPWSNFLFIVAMMLVSARTVIAAGSDNWPCVYRKVAEISLTSVWSGPPLGEAALKWRDDADIVGLVQRLAARRTPEDEARKAIIDLSTSSHEAKVPKLLALLAGLVETINTERAQVIAGLERFGEGQKQLAEVIRNENTKLSAMRADAKTEPAKLTEQSERLVWNLRIFDERQNSLRFVCEVPTLMEQRLFALAKAIQNALK